MPNRIIKESICTSEKISSLSDFEFRLWIGLIVSVDDYGRGDARPAVIKGRVFPFRDRITFKEIDVALHSLAAKGCVSLYTVDGKPYFWFPTWDKHQRIRTKSSKYPSPQIAADCGNSPQIAADCGNSPQIAADCGLNQNPNQNIELESERESSLSGAKEKSADKPRLVRFEPPSEALAIAYFTQQGSTAQEASSFWDYYQSKGWKVGKATMRDWKAAARNWIRRAADYSQKAQGGQNKGGSRSWEQSNPFLDILQEDLNGGNDT